MKKSLKQLKLILMCLPLTLTNGCAKSDCNLGDDHVHLYTKNGYVKYQQSEILSDWGYKWSEEYYYLNHKDIELQNFLDKKNLLVTELNIDKIQKVQSSRTDYIEYEYEYEDYDTVTRYDWDLGEYVQKRVSVTKTDWTTDENHWFKTGNKRLCHPMYQACKVEKNEKGKYTLIRSEYVDDVLEIKDEYPYIEEGYCKMKYITLPREKKLWR